MLDAIQGKWQRNSAIRGKDLTAAMNSLMHAKPDSAPWNLVALGGNGIGHAVSKILNRPDLCDDLCANVIPSVATIQAMMAAYFPLIKAGFRIGRFRPSMAAAALAHRARLREFVRNDGHGAVTPG
jgi:hypothetical protein